MKTMLKLLLLGLLLQIIPQKHFAQGSYPTNEIYGSYGVGSVPQIGISLGFALGNAIGNAIINGIIMKLGGAGVTYEEKITATGAIGLGYNHYVNPRWSIGGVGLFERVDDKLVFSNGNVGTSRVDVWMLLARTDFRWVNNHSFQFYSGVAAGGSYIHSFDVDDPSDSDNDFMFAFQVSPIGLRFGHNFGVFLEGGLGWTGIVSAGISGKF